MTRYDAIRRQLSDIEKHHERALAKLETQFLLKSGYCDDLEDEVRKLTAETERLRGLLKADACEARQAALKVAGYVGGSV